MFQLDNTAGSGFDKLATLLLPSYSENLTNLKVHRLTHYTFLHPNNIKLVFKLATRSLVFPLTTT